MGSLGLEYQGLRGIDGAVWAAEEEEDQGWDYMQTLQYGKAVQREPRTGLTWRVVRIRVTGSTTCVLKTHG